MDKTILLAELRRHWEYAGKDEDISAEIYHDDAVLEFPQGQERFEGKRNFIAWRKQYPSKLDFKIRRIRGQGDLWVAEISVSYDGGPWMLACNIIELRENKISRETIYVMDSWEAPEWRAPWRAQWVDESEG